MGRGVSGGSAFGCGMFGLIGLMVGVVLTVWLGSQLLDGTTGGSNDTTATNPELSSDAAISVAVPQGLDDNGGIKVSGTGFLPGPVTVTLCLTHDVSTTPDPCDATAGATATVAEDGAFDLTFVAPREINVGGDTYDCAAAPGACSLLAHLPDSPDGPTAPITYAADLPATQASVPPSS